MANCFVVSHKTPRCALSLPSRITNKSLEKLQDFFFKTETKTKCSRPRQRLDGPRPRPRLSFLSSMRLETKTLVSRTTSLIKWTKFGQLILRKIIKIVASSAGGAYSAPPAWAAPQVLNRVCLFPLPPLPFLPFPFPTLLPPSFPPFPSPPFPSRMEGSQSNLPSPHFPSPPSSPSPRGPTPKPARTSGGAL